MTFRLDTLLRHFGSAKGGAAIVEFALVAPFLIAMAVGVIQYGGMLIAYQQLHNGIDSGAVYVMRGGTGASTIHDVALSAWTNPPSDANISVNQSCTCPSGTSICTSLCSDGSYPQAYTTISGSGTYTGPYATKSMVTSQTIRTR